MSNVNQIIQNIEQKFISTHVQCIMIMTRARL